MKIGSIFLILQAVNYHAFALQGSAQPRKWIVPEGVPFGDISRLSLTPVEQAPSTKSNQPSVRVATRAVGLNFADIFTVLGYYKAANSVRTQSADSKLASFCPGLEFSGVVQDDASPYFEKGDRVFGFTRFDAYADEIIASPEVLRKLPSQWTFEQGAAFLVNALTAWHGLVTVCGMSDHSKTTNSNIKPEIVVVHSAVGGVGLFACEIAARRGALVVGIAGNPSKFSTFYDRIRPLCPEARCIVRSKNGSQFRKDLLEAVVKARSMRSGINPPEPIQTAEDAVNLGWGADYVMESYGGKYFQPSLDIINAGGSLATYGSTSYNGEVGGNRLAFLPLALQYLRRPRVDPGELTSRNIRIGGFNLIFLTERTDQLAAALADCIDCLEGGIGNKSLATATPPVVGETFAFEKAPQAMRALRSGQTVGKVVLSNHNNPLLMEK